MVTLSGVCSAAKGYVTSACNTMYGKTVRDKNVKKGTETLADIKFYGKQTARAFARLATVSGLGYAAISTIRMVEPTKLGSKLKLSVLTQKASQFAPKKLAVAAGLVAIAATAAWTYKAEKR